MDTNFIETLVIGLLNVWTTMKEINILDKEYAQWVKSLVAKYRQSQVKAAVKVNTEVLRFYWELGKDYIISYVSAIANMDLTFLVEHHLIERLVELNADNAKGTPVFIEP